MRSVFLEQTPFHQMPTNPQEQPGPRDRILDHGCEYGCVAADTTYGHTTYGPSGLSCAHFGLLLYWDVLGITGGIRTNTAAHLPEEEARLDTLDPHSNMGGLTWSENRKCARIRLAKAPCYVCWVFAVNSLAHERSITSTKQGEQSQFGVKTVIFLRQVSRTCCCWNVSFSGARSAYLQFACCRPRCFWVGMGCSK